MNIIYLDLKNGNDSNDGLSFANRKKTFTSAFAALGNTDELRVISDGGWTSIGDITWPSKDVTVTLSSAKTLNINNANTAWTSVASVTTTTDAESGYLGNAVSRISPQTGFTTGKMAYIATASTGAGDYASYEQVSFLMRMTSLVSSGDLELKLCSDTTGDTALHTFSIDIPADLATSDWFTVVIDNAGSLSGTIQSVALYATTDFGANSIDIHNIVAAKAVGSADLLTHRSVISKVNDRTDTAHVIHYIDGTTVKLAESLGDTPTKGYVGTAETVSSYVRQPLISDVAGTYLYSGSGKVDTTISGGWDTTDMSTQSSEGTFIMSLVQDGTSALNFTSGTERTVVSNLGFCWFNRGILKGSSSRSLSLVNVDVIGCDDYAVYASTSFGGLSVDNCRLNNNSDNGLEIASDCGIVTVKDTLIHNNTAQAIDLNDDNSNRNLIIQGCSLRNCNYPIFLYGFYATNTVITDNAQPVLASTHVIMKRCTLDSTPNVGSDGVFLNSESEDGVKDNDFIYQSYGLVSAETGADRNTPSGKAWKFEPTSAAGSEYSPVWCRVSQVICKANVPVSLGAYIKRSNTGLNMRLKVRGGQIAGVDDDVITLASGAAGSYVQETIGFTPTEDGVVEVICEAWGGTTYTGFIDDISKL